MKNLLDPRVVLVMPEPGAQEVVRTALARLGLVGYPADTLRAAQHMATRVDTLMVVFDGGWLRTDDIAATLAAIRGHPGSRATLLVVFAPPEQAERLRTVGADLVVDLPVSPASTLRMLNRLARIPRREQPAAASSVGGPAAAGRLPGPATNGQPDPTATALEDPQRVLARFAKRARARHKIYVGAAPGVGKTYAMLREGQDLAARHVQVVVGVVETHGRTETARQLEGLTVMPRREIAYKGAKLDELDLDGILALAPSTVLVDELAHTNAPGSLNTKRYEDVQVLLLAGIPVVSTLNVQHLESLNNVVERLTGVQVRETLPDGVLEEADEVVLVDISTEALQQRLQTGKIYAKDKVEQSLLNFFTTHNLTALRELVLREIADKVDSGLTDVRGALGHAEPPGIQEVVLVCLTAAPGAARVVRRGARLAERLNAPLAVIHVEVGPPTPAAEQQLARHVALAESFEARVVRRRAVDVAGTIATFAREIYATVIVMGEPKASPWRSLWSRSLLQALLEATANVDIVTVARHEEEGPEPE